METMHAPNPKPTRLASIDLIRGAVMILMAIDHVRVFSGVPAGGPTLGIFFTRWMTHFCAPAFLFLAGTSAFLYGRRHQDLSRFLLVRGIWLVILELTVLRLAWTFNLDFAHYEMAGVIWVIGWSMIIMAVLVKFSVKVVAIIGLVIVAGHNLLDTYVRNLVPTMGNDIGSALWKIMYVGFFAGPVSFGADGPNLIVLYSIIPWIGVMAAGYAFGSILMLEPSRRNRYCFGIGLGAIVLFLVLRGFNIYGDPRPWSPPTKEGQLSSVLSFLNTTKYPASFSFLLMTLGPAIALIPWLEKRRGVMADRIALFGSVPFFYYMLHIPLIHAESLVVSFIRRGEVSSWLFTNHPMGNPPPPNGDTWELWQLYLVWAVTIVVLYFACRWYANFKSGRRDWWLKYV
jgi:uncharacterized membrane protein